MKEVSVIIFGDLSDSEAKAGLNYRNFTIIKRLEALGFLKMVLCFSQITQHTNQNYAVKQFRFSFFSKINTVINKILGAILGELRYQTSIKRLINEFFFDLFCYFSIKPNANTVMLDFKSLSYLTQLKVQAAGGKFLFFAPVCHPLEECIQIKAFCEANNLHESSTYTNKPRNTLYSRYIAKADLIVPFLPSEYVVSTYLKHRIRKELIRLPACPWGIHPSFLKPPQKNYNREGKIVFFCTDAGSHKKGVKILLEAWKQLMPKAAELWIVGEHHQEAQYQAIASIKWLEYNDNIQEYYFLSDVFVCPSVIDLGPRAVFEAMASGLAIIVSDKCGSSEFVDPANGLVFTSGSKNDLAEKLNYLMQNRHKLAEMGNSSHQKSLTFDTDKYVTSIIHSINEVAS